MSSKDKGISFNMAHTRDGMTGRRVGNLVGLDGQVGYLGKIRDLM